jgi:hypothetical protein
MMSNGQAFITKDSGERQIFSTGMQRDAAVKDLRPDLIPLPMLVRWAELMGRGAAKYEARNWEKASTIEELERAYDSAFRHFVQWRRGDTDEDHAAAVFFNIGLAEHVKARLEEDRAARARALMRGGLPSAKLPREVSDTELPPGPTQPDRAWRPNVGDEVVVCSEGSSFDGRHGTVQSIGDRYTSGEFGVDVALAGEDGGTLHFYSDEILPAVTLLSGAV